MISSEEVYFFNKENVERIIFTGYIDEIENEFAEKYDSLVNHSRIEKGSI